MSTEDGRDGGLSVFGYTVSPRGVQPRVVLGLLLAGSYVGVWLSHLGNSVLIRSYWWVVVAAVGLLTGGLYWRLFLFDGETFGDCETRRAIRDRWRRLETVGVWGVTICGATGLGVRSIPLTIDVGAIALLAGSALAPVLWVAIASDRSDRVSGQRTRLRYALFGAGVISLCGFAWLETGTGIVDWLVRVGHVGSFALWFGGASWHNFVVLPTIRSNPDAKAALKSQARRFRRHLPVVIPLFFLTGLYQVVVLVGPTVPPVSAPVGRLVWFKLLVLAALTGLVVASLRRTKTPSGN